jgi:sRNA-binding regulator protein Hfq
MDLTQDLDRRGPRSPHEERYERISLHEVELIKLRDNRTVLQVKLVSGETLEGAIRWYDHNAIRLVRPDRTELTIFRHSIAYYMSCS